MADFFPVVRLIVVGDETNHSCIIRKLHDVVGAEGECAVIGQQGEEQETEYTSLGGRCTQHDGA